MICKSCHRHVELLRGPDLCPSCFTRVAEELDLRANAVRRKLLDDGILDPVIPMLPNPLRDRLMVDQQQPYWCLDTKGEPVECTFGHWALCMQGPDRIVAQQWVGETEVSTVFRGIDMSMGGRTPLLWESMTFSNRKSMDRLMERCGGPRESAVQMHRLMVEHVAQLEGVDPPLL